jgi:hypothetical protein
VGVARAIGLALGALVVAAVFALGTPDRTHAATPPGSLGLQLLDVPAATQLDPRARLYIVDHVAPGAVLRRRIQVTSSAASAIPVVLYAAAAAITNDTFVGSAGHARNEVSSWMSVRPGRFEIRPGGRRIAMVTIDVPRDASPGERYGVVWAEERSAPAGGVGITQVSRVGIRVYLSVGPGGPPAADFKIGSLTGELASDGRPTVLATVRNTGGRALDMSGTLRLRNGPGGLSAGPFPADLGVTLGIGDAGTITVALDRRVPAGPWLAQVTLRSGLLVRTARATITFPVGRAPAPGSSRPILLVGGLVALILGALVLLLVLRRRRLTTTTSRGVRT